MDDKISDILKEAIHDSSVEFNADYDRLIRFLIKFMFKELLIFVE